MIDFKSPLYFSHLTEIDLENFKALKDNADFRKNHCFKLFLGLSHRYFCTCRAYALLVEQDHAGPFRVKLFRIIRMRSPESGVFRNPA